MGVNPILFLDPDGKIVAETDAGKATTKGLLATLQLVLQQHPKFAMPSASEAAITDAIERAELLMDLGRDQEADGVLAEVDKPRGHLLRAQLARRRQEFAAMNGFLKKVAGDAELADDVRMEQAHELWHTRHYEQLGKHLADFPSDSNRFTEARYYEGLGHFHAGRTKQARKLWRDTIKAARQDGWIYRMDWAWADTSQQFGQRTPLGRIGYMGAYRNHDVVKR